MVGDCICTVQVDISILDGDRRGGVGCDQLKQGVDAYQGTKSNDK